MIAAARKAAEAHDEKARERRDRFELGAGLPEREGLSETEGDELRSPGYLDD